MAVALPFIAVGAQLLNVGLNQHNANKANKNAAAAAASANRIAQQKLDFTKERYAEWESIYGPLQKNLGDYYTHLGPQKLAAQGLEYAQAEFDAAKDVFQKELVSRGLHNSGVEVYSLAQAEFAHAGNRAAIRSNADTEVKRQQTGFLSIGLQDKARIEGAVGGAFDTQVGVHNSYAGQQLQVGANADQNTTNILNSASGELLGLSGLNSILKYQKDQADLANPQGDNLDKFAVGGGNATYRG